MENFLSQNSLPVDTPLTVRRNGKKGVMGTCKRNIMPYSDKWAVKKKKKKSLLLITHFVCLLTPFSHGNDPIHLPPTHSRNLMYVLQGM